MLWALHLIESDKMFLWFDFHSSEPNYFFFGNRHLNRSLSFIPCSELTYFTIFAIDGFDRTPAEIFDTTDWLLILGAAVAQYSPTSLGRRALKRGDQLNSHAFAGVAFAWPEARWLLLVR